MIRYEYLSPNHGGDHDAGLDFATTKPATLTIVYSMPTTFTMHMFCMRNGT